MANLSNINNVLRVSTDLRVGINTDAASYALEIGGTNSGIKLKNSDATSGRVYSLLSDTAGNFQIYDDAAASGRLVINSGGNATFAASITVNGVSSTLNTGNSGTFVTNDANDYPRISTSSANIQLGLFRTSTGTGGVYIGGFSGGFEVRNGSTLAPIFNVDQSGNGDFAGSALLDGLASDGYRIYKIRLQAPYTGGWGSITPGTVIGGLQQTNFRTDGGASNIAAAVDFELENNTYGTGQTSISFKCGGVNGVDSTEKMRIDSNGNVGIGTDEPVSTWLSGFDPSTGNGTFKLTSEGWIVTPYLTGLAGYYPGQGARPIVWADDSGTNLQCWDNSATDGVSIRSSNGTTRLFVKENGNVGIDAIPETGMVTYVKQLRLGEQSALQGHAQGVGQDSATWLTTNYKFTTSGTVFINGTAAAPGYANFYQQQLGDHSFGCSPSSGVAGAATGSRIQLMIKQSGNVGIGTNSPPVKLSINGWSYNPGAAANAGMIGLKQGNNSAYGFVAEASDTDKWIMMGHNSSHGIIETTYAASAGHSDLYIKTGSSNSLILQSTGGKVGIGATSANTKLDVRGTTGTRNHNTTSGYGSGSSIYETSRYYSVAGSATTNVSIDTTTSFPPMASGGYILVEVSASGYASGGANGLVFSWISGGFGGHSGPLSYHPIVVIANNIANGSVAAYYPNSTTVGITIVNGSSQSIQGLMRVKVTTTY